jgi:hypothetical protein
MFRQCSIQQTNICRRKIQPFRSRGWHDVRGISHKKQLTKPQRLDARGDAD